MKLFDLLLSLIFVPKCVSCRTRLPFDATTPLCQKCRAEYENEKARTCAVCAARLSDCSCTPPEVNCGTKKTLKIFRYRPAHPELATQQMIFALKHRRNASLCRLLAGDLSAAVLREVGKRKEKYIITYPPRSKSAIRKNGFDHTEMLAKALGEQTGIPVRSTLRRTGGVMQKKLSRTERMKNALASFAPRKDVSLDGKRVLLVDDVVTTGATLAAAARHLRRMGAREVITVAVAITLREGSI